MGQVGSLALSIGGKIAGTAFGGPIGGAIGGMAGGLIGGLLFNRAKKPLIPDYQLANSSYGHPIPIIYGQERLAATAIWETEIITKTRGLFGKGLGGNSTPRYLQSAAFAFCEGPAQLLKMWLDGKLFYDNTASNPNVTKWAFPMRTYTGSEDQLPDPLIQAWVKDHVIPFDATPAYRGLAYLVFEGIDLAHFGNRMPNISATWSNNASESVVVKKLQFWDDDTDVTEFVPAWEGAVAVDWVRQYVYTVSYTGLIRCFDIRTGLCINKVDAIKQLTALSVFLQANPGLFGWYTAAQWPLSGIASEPGGDVYTTNIPVLSNDHLSWTNVYMWRLDAGLTQTISQMPMPKPSVVNNWVATMKCFDLVSPTGVFPMIVGKWVVGPAFLMDPNFGYYTTLPTADVSIFGRQFYVVGQLDDISGTADVWILNATIAPAGAPLRIYKAYITGNDVSALVTQGNFTQVGTLSPADFGITPTPPSWEATLITAVYDASDDTLILSDFSLNASIKWSPGTGVLWVKDNYTLNPNGPQNNVVIDAGKLANGFTNSIRTVWVDDTLTGADQSVYTAAELGGRDVVGNYGYASSANAILFSTGERQAAQLYVVYLQRFAGGRVRVADIIADLCIRVGLTADMIDVSLVSDTTWGYVVADQKSAGMAVLDLCHVFQIDMVESDYLLKFVPRGQAVVATIAQQDLVSINPQEPGQFWEAKRAQEQELPLQINVRYTDPFLDFQPGSSYAKRVALPVPTTFSKRVKTIDLPVVSDAVEARHIAERWLYTMWAERDTFHSKFGWKYLFLDPTDNVKVNLDNGDSYTVRIEATEVGADFTMDVELASEDTTTYVLSNSPGALVSFTPQTLAPATFVELLQFNIPLLQDSDDLGGLQSRIYYAAAALSTANSSSSTTLYQSSDANTWSTIQESIAFANWGRARNVLPDTPATFATDTANTVTIGLAVGSTSPASCSYLDLMNGVNAALLGQEIIQFGNVATNADGSITLSTLVRGRRGTDWATGLHKEGEVFLLLAVDQVSGTRLPLSEIGTTEFYKLVPLNAVLSAVPTDAFRYQGYDLMPYAPVNFKRANSGSDLVITWNHRTRIGGLLLDGTDTVPLAESTEAYEIYLLSDAAAIDSFDPTTPASYVRTYSPVTTSVTYTAAQMATDSFTRATDELFVAAYQISSVVGRGFRAYARLPAF